MLLLEQSGCSYGAGEQDRWFAPVFVPWRGWRRWNSSCELLFAFQDFYDEQGVFAENFWPQSEPPQAMAFNPRGRVSKALTPPPTTQSINNQVSDHAQLDGRRGDLKLPAYWEGHLKRSRSHNRGGGGALPSR